MIYADPGSGVLIWQILLALFFGATFSFSKLKAWAMTKFRPELNNDPLKTAENGYSTQSSPESE